MQIYKLKKDPGEHQDLRLYAAHKYCYDGRDQYGQNKKGGI